MFVGARFLSLAGILVLLATPAFADCEPQPIARFPLLPGPYPAIELPINGTPMPLVIDTGSEKSSVTPAAAAALHLPLDVKHRTRVVGVGGQKETENAFVSQLGDTTFGFLDQSIAIVPLPIPARAAGPVPAGLIGGNLLNEFDIELDFAAQRLTIFRASECGAVRPPWTPPYQTVVGQVSRRHQFLLPIVLNGHELTAMFDTGSLGETVSRHAANRVGVGDAELDHDPSGTGASAGSASYALKRHRFDTLGIGTEVFRNISLDVVDFLPSDTDALLGTDYMRRGRFFVSYSTGTLFIQRDRRVLLPAGVPAAPAPAACRPPPDLLPTLSRVTPIAVSRPRLALPEEIVAGHVNGCAGVIFRLNADGMPTDLKLVTETPAGLGVGQFVMREIAETRYQPPPAASGWYFEVHRFAPSANR